VSEENSPQGDAKGNEQSLVSLSQKNDEANAKDFGRCDERTNHAAFFVGRCDGDIFIKNGSFSIQRRLKVSHSTKISTKFVEPLNK
jgi:hypothetical protein